MPLRQTYHLYLGNETHEEVLVKILERDSQAEVVDKGIFSIWIATSLLESDLYDIFDRTILLSGHEQVDPASGEIRDYRTQFTPVRYRGSRLLYW